MQNDVLKARMPIHCRLLELILFELGRHFGTLQQPYLNKLYQALFALGYYGLFRIGELVSGDHTIKAKNVHIAKNKEKILIILYTSKTHGKESRPQK